MFHLISVVDLKGIIDQLHDPVYRDHYGDPRVQVLITSAYIVGIILTDRIEAVHHTEEPVLSTAR